MSAYRPFRSASADFSPFPAPKAPKAPKEEENGTSTLGGLGALGGVDPSNSTSQAGVTLGDDGLPASPCLTCGGSSFWCPAGDPLGSIRPEFGPWRCDLCEPRPAEVYAHAFGLATVPRATIIPDAPAMPYEPRRPAGPPARDLPAWDDGQSWGQLVTNAGPIGERAVIVQQWVRAAGGAVRVIDGATVLLVPVPRHEVICLDMQRVAGDAGMAMRFDVPPEELER